MQEGDNYTETQFGAAIEEEQALNRPNDGTDEEQAENGKKKGTDKEQPLNGLNIVTEERAENVQQEGMLHKVFRKVKEWKKILLCGLVLLALLTLTALFFCHVFGYCFCDIMCQIHENEGCIKDEENYLIYQNASSSTECEFKRRKGADDVNYLSCTVDDSGRNVRDDCFDSRYFKVTRTPSHITVLSYHEQYYNDVPDVVYGYKMPKSQELYVQLGKGRKKLGVTFSHDVVCEVLQRQRWSYYSLDKMQLMANSDEDDRNQLRWTDEHIKLDSCNYNYTAIQLKPGVNFAQAANWSIPDGDHYWNMTDPSNPVKIFWPKYLFTICSTIASPHQTGAFIKLSGLHDAIYKEWLNECFLLTWADHWMKLAIGNYTCG